jgi:hypothetical protein
MKIGVLLFVIGLLLALYLLKIKFEKKILTNIGIVVAVLFVLYGLILMVQPSDDEYVKFTKSTVSKDINSSK